MTRLPTHMLDELEQITYACPDLPLWRAMDKLAESTASADGVLGKCAKCSTELRAKQVEKGKCPVCDHPFLRGRQRKGADPADLPKAKDDETDSGEGTGGDTAEFEGQESSDSNATHKTAAAVLPKKLALYLKGAGALGAGGYAAHLMRPEEEAMYEEGVTRGRQAKAVAGRAFKLRKMAGVRRGNPVLRLRGTKVGRKPSKAIQQFLKMKKHRRL